MPQRCGTPQQCWSQQPLQQAVGQEGQDHTGEDKQGQSPLEVQDASSQQEGRERWEWEGKHKKGVSDDMGLCGPLRPRPLDPTGPSRTWRAGTSPNPSEPQLLTWK